jgi:hypothetical protein
MAVDVDAARLYCTTAEVHFGPQCADDDEAETLRAECYRTIGDPRGLDRGVLDGLLSDIRAGTSGERPTLPREPYAPMVGCRVYLPNPGYEHNAWVIRRLLDAGLTPDISFPSRSGRNPRFLLWSYYRADGKRIEYSTTYGRLSEQDVAQMLGRAA